MRWQMGRRSDNVEDRRGTQVSAPVVGGGIGVVILSLIVALLGGDPSALWEQGAPTTNNPSVQAPRNPGAQPNDQAADFVSVVLADTEDTWGSLFQQSGRRYVEPSLVLFSDAVESACGFAQSASGPFYCPRDQKVYLDLSFFRDLQTRYGAPGDFAQAYVIAHEVGHHVQKQLGILDKVSRLQRQVGKAEANQLSVRLELQADCFAGIWAHHAQRSRQVLEAGDIEEGLAAASSVGDDQIQRRTQGYVVPDAFTHGSAAQRVRWFKRGVQTGDPDQCDTFSTASL